MSMPSFIQEGLVGSQENFATTIRAAIDRDWDTNNAAIMPKPAFISGENSQATVNPTEMKESITFDEGTKRNLDRQTDNDWMNFGMENDVIITVFGTTQSKRELLENEVHRVLRKIVPTNGSKIKKSNNTEDSAILGFENPLPQFIPFGVGTNQAQKASRSQAILKVRWQNTWTP